MGSDLEKKSLSWRLEQEMLSSTLELGLQSTLEATAIAPWSSYAEQLGLHVTWSGATGSRVAY